MQVVLNYIAIARCLTIVAVFPFVAVLARACVVVHEVRAITVNTRL